MNEPWHTKLAWTQLLPMRPLPHKAPQRVHSLQETRQAKATTTHGPLQEAHWKGVTRQALEQQQKWVVWNRL